MKPSRSELLEKPTFALEYRSLGIVRGIYQGDETQDPSDPQFRYGSLTTPEGQSFKAFILNKSLSGLLKKQPECIGSEQLWTVYVRTHPSLQFQLKHLRTDIAMDEFEDIVSVRGVIEKIKQGRDRAPSEQSIEIKVRRNVDPDKPSNNDQESKPRSFTIVVHGKLPLRVNKGQFVDVIATRHQDKLMLEEIELLSERDPKPETDQEYDHRREHQGQKHRSDRNATNERPHRPKRPVSPRNKIQVTDFRQQQK